MPIIADNDREAIQTLLSCCQGMDLQRPEIILINNSLELDRILITPWLLDKAVDQERIQALPGELALRFGAAGELLTEI